MIVVLTLSSGLYHVMVGLGFCSYGSSNFVRSQQSGFVFQFATDFKTICGERKQEARIKCEGHNVVSFYFLSDAMELYFAVSSDQVEMQALVIAGSI